MNRKQIKFLYEDIDYTTLADIAIKEKENNGRRNVYYDLITKEAILFPEDDYDGLKIKPLYARLLKSGHRLNTELSKFLVKSIEYATNTPQDQIKLDLLERHGVEIDKDEVN